MKGTKKRRYWYGEHTNLDRMITSRRETSAQVVADNGKDYYDDPVNPFKTERAPMTY